MNLRAVQSGSARIRLRQAHQFVSQFPAGTEVLLLGASRGAVDDLARTIAMEKGATFGLHRLSFTQLAARLAAIGAGGERTGAVFGSRLRSRRRTRGVRSRQRRSARLLLSGLEHSRFSESSRAHAAGTAISRRRRRTAGGIAAKRTGSRRSARSRRDADGRGRRERPRVAVRHGDEGLDPSPLTP